MVRYIIECRKPDGSLDFSGRQPESVFGPGVYRGLTEDQIAKQVYAREPDAVLTGNRIASWPSVLDPRWIARKRYGR